jgi:subtilisin-like proprotein convertase family protein
MIEAYLMGFIADGIAGWIGAAGSIVAVGLTIFIYFLTRKKKVLSYEVVSEYPLISINDELKGKLKVLYDGNPVENVHLLLFRFVNAGNVPITTTDFEKPLTVRFSGNSTVLSAERVKANPDNLTLGLKVENSVITIEPALMNAGDFFTTKALIGEYGGSFDVDARIVGVKAIRVARRQARLQVVRLPLWAAFLSLVVALILLILSFISFKGLDPKLREVQTTANATPSPSPATPSPLPVKPSYEASFENSNSLMIPYSGSASPYPSSILVSGATGTLAKLSVEISDVSHTNTGDLAILLVGPNGKSVTLMSDVGGGKFIHTNLAFDDDAPISKLFTGESADPKDQPAFSSNPVPSGVYRPTNYKKRKHLQFAFPGISNTPEYSNLSVFNGIDPNGTWSLYVVDDAPIDSGRIGGGWKLRMKINPKP